VTRRIARISSPAHGGNTPQPLDAAHCVGERGGHDVLSASRRIASHPRIAGRCALRRGSPAVALREEENKLTVGAEQAALSDLLGAALLLAALAPAVRHAVLRAVGSY
jgi:hypothetical protein